MSCTGVENLYLVSYCESRNTQSFSYANGSPINQGVYVIEERHFKGIWSQFYCAYLFG